MPRYLPKATRKFTSSLPIRCIKKSIIKKIHFKKEYTRKIKIAAGFDFIDLTKKNQRESSPKIKSVKKSINIRKMYHKNCFN